MALKTPVVYGELSLLLSQIRHKIEHNPDGSSFKYVLPLLARDLFNSPTQLLPHSVPPHRRN